MLRPGLISALAALLLCASCAGSEQPSAPAASLCTFESGPCSRLMDGQPLSLNIKPAPPRAMTELEFHVLSPSSVEPYMINLMMPGMQMGLNRIELVRGDDGSYSGMGVLPRCPTGGRLWRAEVMVRDGRVVGFDFEVR